MPKRIEFNGSRKIEIDTGRMGCDRIRRSTALAAGATGATSEQTEALGELIVAVVRIRSAVAKLRRLGFTVVYKIEIVGET